MKIKVEYFPVLGRQVMIRKAPFNRRTKSVLHVLGDANFQPKFIKVMAEPEEFSLVGFEIKLAQAEENRYDRWRRYYSPEFAKGLLKDPLPSQKQKSIEAGIARRRELLVRNCTIMEAHGVLIGPDQGSFIALQSSYVPVQQAILRGDIVEPYQKAA